MATPVYVPKWGDIMEDGVVLAWLKAEGEPVQAGEALLELETEKVSGPIEAPADGVMGPHLVPAGERVPVGSILTYILAPGEGSVDVGR